MKKVTAALATLVLLLTACGGTAEPNAVPDPKDVPSESKLAEWIKVVGLSEQLNAFAKSMKSLGSDLEKVDSTDLPAVAAAMAKQGPAILDVANSIAAQPANDNKTYEGYRTAAAFTIRSFGELAVELGAATDADRLTKITEATEALSPMNAAIKALAEYIQKHGTDTVHPAS